MDITRLKQLAGIETLTEATTDVTIKPSISWHTNGDKSQTIKVTYEYDGEVIDGPYIHSNKVESALYKLIKDRYPTRFYHGRCVGQEGMSGYRSGRG